MSWEVIEGDCLDVMADMEPGSVDAVVTDPPYGLQFMAKHWDRGVPGPAFWYQAFEVLKPGGHLLAFGGTRTFHRLAVAIEDSGFEIRDCLSWMYGSGFPKSLNLDGDWTGWGTALKPAWEPIIMARKPLAGTVVANVQEHGTGAINVDACRVRGEVGRNWSECVGQENTNSRMFGIEGKITPPHESGRWPANVCLDEHAAAMLDEQSGVTTSTGGCGDSWQSSKFGMDKAPPVNRGEHGIGLGDTGGASRFFYCAKASRSERGEGNNHPTVKPVALMRWLVRLVTPPGGLVLDPFMGSGTTGVAAMEEGFNFIGIEIDPGYCEIARARIGNATRQQRLDIAPAPKAEQGELL
jgi:site-specific DNA-methyltransferase (adenine-specific)